jgi:hypothetical protein
MSSSITGELVTESLDYDGGRQVTGYVPPVAPEAVVFAGDGQLISQWGGVLEADGAPPTMIVGAHRLDKEMLRLGEYSPVFDAHRFAAHEKFFVEDVRQWARSRFSVALPRRAHGGVWCLRQRRARPRPGAGPSWHLRRGLLRVAGRRLPGTCRDAQFASARLPRRRHAGAVLPQERDPLGHRAARRRCRRCHDRTGRVARRRVLERRVPADGGMGVRALSPQLVGGPAAHHPRSPPLRRAIGLFTDHLQPARQAADPSQRSSRCSAGRRGSHAGASRSAPG